MEYCTFELPAFFLCLTRGIVLQYLSLNIKKSTHSSNVQYPWHDGHLKVIEEFHVQTPLAKVLAHLNCEHYFEHWASGILKTNSIRNSNEQHALFIVLEKNKAIHLVERVFFQANKDLIIVIYTIYFLHMSPLIQVEFLKPSMMQKKQKNNSSMSPIRKKSKILIFFVLSFNTLQYFTKD